MFCDNLRFFLQSFLLINRLSNTNLKTKLNGSISLVLLGKYLKRGLFNGLFNWKIIICQHHLQAKCLYISHIDRATFEYKLRNYYSKIKISFFP